MISIIDCVKSNFKKYSYTREKTPKTKLSNQLKFIHLDCFDNFENGEKKHILYRIQSFTEIYDHYAMYIVIFPRSATI